MLHPFTAGSPEDKVRLFIINLICGQDMSSVSEHSPCVNTCYVMRASQAALALHENHHAMFEEHLSEMKSMEIECFQSEVDQYCNALAAAGCDLNAIQYIRRWKWVEK